MNSTLNHDEDPEVLASPEAQGYVAKALGLLGKGIGPYVARKFETALVNGAINDNSDPRLRTNRITVEQIEAGDAYAVLAATALGWNPIGLHRSTPPGGWELSFPERGYASLLFAFRNRLSHQGPYDDRTAHRHLGMFVGLLRAFGADPQAREIEEYEFDLGRQIYGRKNVKSPDDLLLKMDVLSDLLQSTVNDQAPQQTESVPSESSGASSDKPVASSSQESDFASDAEPSAAGSASHSIRESGSPAGSVPADDFIVGLNPSSPSSGASELCQQGINCLRTNDYAQATSIANHVLQLDSNYTPAYGLRGYASYCVGQYDAAIRDLSAFLDSLPEGDHYSSYIRGEAYQLGRGDYERAIADYTEAIRLEPQIVAYRRMRGEAYIRQGDHERAIADYNKVIELEPANIECLRRRTEICLRLEIHDAAIRDLTTLIDLCKTSPRPEQLNDFLHRKFYIQRSEAYLATEQYGLAIADCNKALELFFYGGAPLRVRGAAYRALGLNELADEDLGLTQRTRIDDDDWF